MVRGNLFLPPLYLPEGNTHSSFLFSIPSVGPLNTMGGSLPDHSLDLNFLKKSSFPSTPMSKGKPSLHISPHSFDQLTVALALLLPLWTSVSLWVLAGTVLKPLLQSWDTKYGKEDLIIRKDKKRNS